MAREFTYSDVHPGLDLDANGNITVLYDRDVIIQSIKSILTTISGERVRSPIGSSLVSLLFSPINEDTALAISTSIRNAIAQYEPRVTIDSLVVTPDEDSNTYVVSLVMTVKKITGAVKFQSRLQAMGNF